MLDKPMFYLEQFIFLKYLKQNVVKYKFLFFKLLFFDKSNDT